jgi:hypothetical protein
LGFELAWWASFSVRPRPPASPPPGHHPRRTAGVVRLTVAGFGRRRRGSYAGTVWCVRRRYVWIDPWDWLFRSLSQRTCCRCTLSLQVAHVERRMGCCVCKPREIPRRQKGRLFVDSSLQSWVCLMAFNVIDRSNGQFEQYIYIYGYHNRR